MNQEDRKRFDSIDKNIEANGSAIAKLSKDVGMIILKLFGNGTKEGSAFDRIGKLEVAQSEMDQKLGRVWTWQDQEKYMQRMETKEKAAKQERAEISKAQNQASVDSRTIRGMMITAWATIGLGLTSLATIVLALVHVL